MLLHFWLMGFVTLHKTNNVRQIHSYTKLCSIRLSVSCLTLSSAIAVRMLKLWFLNLFCKTRININTVFMTHYVQFPTIFSFCDPFHVHHDLLFLFLSLSCRALSAAHVLCVNSTGIFFLVPLGQGHKREPSQRY
jgi:hypothetical protein